MPQIPVSVTVDFTNVSVNGNQFSENPAWSVDPQEVQCHNGQNTLTWTLTATNLPAGSAAASAAAFPQSGAIEFKTSNSQGWSGGPPTTQPNGKAEATDNFQNLTIPVKFFYTTYVVLTKPSITSQTYSYDPDVEDIP